MAPKLCNSIWHDGTLKFWYFHRNKCFGVGKRHCATLAEMPSILNTPTIPEQFFLMLKYPSSTNTVHFGYYKGNKKQDNYLQQSSKTISLIVLVTSLFNRQLITQERNCKSRLPETVTFLTSFWALFILLLVLQATKVHMNMLQRPLWESDAVLADISLDQI